ncbi:MAG: hypothetical protein IIC32_03205 [Chloroflexi bacterium]|nr:hypothetical protein [Chloroflexota bacterium]
MDYSVRMDTSSTTALARAAPAALRPAGGMVALARALRSPRLRRAAVAGAAFGLGFQLSRALRAGRPWRLGSAARRADRTAAGDEPPATAWRQGGWAWRSLTIVTVGYRAFQRDE